jgi:dienelactone hydrolase
MGSMSLLSAIFVATTLVAVGWWVVARHRWQNALDVLSLASLGLAVVTLGVEGMRWQLVPWQLLALTVAVFVGLRRWRPGRSHRSTRVLSRVALLAGLLVGGLALLFAFVPTLPEPSGPHHVGSVVFRWTDSHRPESFTADTQDLRQVVAQAWYPTEATQGARVPYFEAQDRLPGSVVGFPRWFFDSFGQVDTHARMSVPVSSERDVWPVLLFSPGLNSPREMHTALAADLASRGYVVVALSHPYDSPVSVLANGRIVGQATPELMGPASPPDMAQQVDIRAADSSFVLDQLSRLAEIEPNSPLAGHLDLRHVGIVGHSVGGATAAQLVDHDPRFLVGVNIDGRLFGAEPNVHLNRPFLWLQSGGATDSAYVQTRDRLLGGLQAGGALLVVQGSLHMSFSDAPAWLSRAGRVVLGGALGSGSNSTQEMTSRSADVISAFVAPYVDGPSSPTLQEAIASHPSIRLEREFAVAAPTR